ncbi:MAG: hypothetical protein RR939_12265 [Acinetobacter sp.]
MSFKENLQFLADRLLAIHTYSPDQYPSWRLEYYNNAKEIFDEDMSGVLDLWKKIKPKIKKDLEAAELVDQKINAMFIAFKQGDNEEGRDIAYEIFDLDIEKMR